ncbi:MAG: pilus assembly protein [Pirellulales bacterium]|nr:pilus assembly protein [Pirellulales bacterium]
MSRSRPAIRRPARACLGSRRGLAATELAVCLPLLVLIVFGSIQACNLIYLRHGLVTAAYEGTLELAKPNASNASIRVRAEQVLAARGIRNAQLQILPAGTEASSSMRGTPLTIDIRAEVKPNIALSGFFPLPNEVRVRLAGTR